MWLTRGTAGSISTRTTVTSGPSRWILPNRKDVNCYCVWWSTATWSSRTTGRTCSTISGWDTKRFATISPTSFW